VRTPRALVAIVAAALIFSARGLGAQSGGNADQKQFWPEVDYYQDLGKRNRLFAQVLGSTGANNVFDNVQFGVNFDTFLKPHPILAHIKGAESLIEDRLQPALLRIGYRYSESLNGATPAYSNRILAELSYQRDLFGGSLADRNGFDWRWTNGDWSTRYRNRVNYEHTAKIRKYDFTPYANAEWFYSLQSNAWTSVKYEAGVQLPVRRHFTTDIYLGLQNNWGTAPSSTVGFGLTLVFSF
jgi:hypothetical protein